MFRKNALFIGMLSVFFGAYRSYGMDMSNHTPVNSIKYEFYEMGPSSAFLQRLANPFKTDDKEAIELIKQLKIDSNKIFVISVKSKYFLLNPIVLLTI